MKSISRGLVNRLWQKMAVSGACLGLVAAACFIAPATFAMAPQAAKADGKSSAGEYATLIFRTGQTLTGTIVTETATVVRFKTEAGGIPFESDYNKSEILEIKRSGKKAETKPAIGSASVTPSAKASDIPSAAGAQNGVNAERVYNITLSGKFGQDITQTPLRRAVKDAQTNNADVIIITIDNQIIEESDDARGEVEEENRYAEINELFRAEKIMPVVTDEIKSEWQKKPRIIYWVRRALGGICFLPLTSQDVYFHPEGKLGGVGDLNDMRRAGHRRVVEKQISLRRGHAVGWVTYSGYPYADTLVRALTQDDFVASLRIVDGKPELFEGYPSNPGEELLTDDGKGPNADNIVQVARGEGNDVLTIDARIGLMMGISKGTYETRDELLAALGYRTDQIVSGRSDQIMKNWTKGFEQAKSTLRRLGQEYGDIQVQGDWNERKAARSAQISKLEQIKGVFREWSEAFEWRWLRQNGFPVNGEGEPDIAEITATQDQIRTAQLLDRR